MTYSRYASRSYESAIARDIKTLNGQWLPIITKAVKIKQA
jgi:hypothetical protein